MIIVQKGIGYWCVYIAIGCQLHWWSNSGNHLQPSFRLVMSPYFLGCPTRSFVYHHWPKQTRPVWAYSSMTERQPSYAVGCSLNESCTLIWACGSLPVIVKMDGWKSVRRLVWTYGIFTRRTGYWPTAVSDLFLCWLMSSCALLLFVVSQSTWPRTSCMIMVQQLVWSGKTRLSVYSNWNNFSIATWVGSR